MPSQEEYLDNLLNGINGEKEQTADISEEMTEAFQSEESEYQPEEAEIQPEEEVLQSEELEYQPEEETFQAEESEYRPEEAEMQPEEEAFQSEESEYQSEDPLTTEEVTYLTQEEIEELLRENQKQQPVEMPEKPVDDGFLEDMDAMLGDFDEKTEKEEASEEASEETVKDKRQARKAERQARKEAHRKEKEAAKQAKREARQKKVAPDEEKENEAVIQGNGTADNKENGSKTAHEPIDETDEIFADIQALGDLDSLTESIGNDGAGIMGDLSRFGLDGDLFDSSAENEAALGEDIAEKDDLAEESGEKQSSKKETEKKGFFAKLLDLVTEEEEDDEAESLRLSDENKSVLKELDQEGDKKKKKKKKKGGKADSGNQEDDGEDADEQEDKKSKKAKKQKKPKKAPKLSPADEKPSPKLSRKKVSLIFLSCFSIGAAIWVLGNVGVDYTDKKTAENAFYEGDYETCYQNLAGKSLNESQQVMYGKSESILRIRMWKKEYEILEEEGARLEALDSLIRSVHDYPVLYAFSDQYNASAEVAEIYSQLLEILNEEFSLSEEQAMKIASEENDVEYTKKVKAVLSGEGENRPEDDAGSETPDVLEDELPEEEDLGGVEFIDNNN